MIQNIYTYIENNFNIKVTDYQFKRDYIKNPLKKVSNIKGGLIFEKPYKEDLEYLYLKLNIRKRELSSLFNVGTHILTKWNKFYNITKPTTLRYNNIQNTCIKLFNAPNVFSNNSNIISDIRNTVKNKYNVDNIFQAEIIKNKIKETNLKKYGFKFATQSPIIKEKTKNTCLSKYNVICYAKSVDFHKKYLNNEYCQNLSNKIYNTKKHNKSLTTSKEEESLYKKLKIIFPKTISHYKNEVYPFSCDFYIPEIDTYIEYQGYWTHGKEPYDDTNLTHQQIIKLWNQKSLELNFKHNTKNQYKRAIEIWSIEDPLKRQIAKDNKLNWLEFFSIKDFNNWYDKIKMGI